MSIVDKLTYLQTTKQLLKTEINKINNVLDDNSTFRSYPQELFNGYLDVLNNGTDTLWNNLEKVSASGEEATLENVETAPMKMVLNGNTSQDTTSGKNKFSINQATYVKKYGSSYSVTGEEIIVTPTTTWGNVTYSYNVKNNTTYTLKMKITFEGTTQTRWWLSLGNETNEAIYNVGYINLEDGYLIKTFTTTSETLLISFQGSTTIQPTSVLFSEIQLEEGSTATSYEPYTGGQPSPSPDYPQQVKVVKGENVVSISGENQSDKTDYPINLVSKNLLTGTFRQGNSSGDPINRRIFADDNYYVEKGKTYILSTNLDVSQFNYALNISWDNFPTSVIFDSKWLTLNQYIFTAKMSGHIGIPVRKADESALTPTDIQDVWFKLEETIYGEETSLELCKINTYKDYFHKDSGKWYVHKEIGKYEVLSENIIDVQDVYTNVKYFDFPKPTDDASRGNYNVSNVLYTNAIYQYVYPFDTLVGIGKIIPNASKNNYRVGFKKGTTLTEAQEKLTNSILYYTLATPTETEITNSTLIEQLEAISKAKSVKDKTYITQTNEELPFILDVEAIKEYEVN